MEGCQNHTKEIGASGPPQHKGAVDRKIEYGTISDPVQGLCGLHEVTEFSAAGTVAAHYFARRLRTDTRE